MPPDEKSLRKPGFREGEPMTLGDGREWSVPLPIVTFGLAFDEGRPSFRRTDLGLGPDYLEALARFHDADGVEQLNVGAELVCRVLRCNYDLADEDLAALLPYVPSDPANVAMWRELIAIATGSPDPKDEPEEDI